MGTLIKKKIIYSGGSPQYYEMPDHSEDLLGTIVQFVGTTDTNYTNGYFYKCVEVVPATNPKTYKWERCDVQPNGSIDAYTKAETDALLDEKASLDISEISTAGGGKEVHATISQGEDEASVNYYKTTELPNTLNLNIGPDSFRLPTAGYVDAQIPDVSDFVTDTELATELALKADKATTYTKTEVDSLIPDVSDFVTDTELVSGLATKADAATTYTKTETDTLLNSKADASSVYTKSEVDAELADKQDELVSGTNIKTINNQSLLGEGNIDIDGKLDFLTPAEVHTICQGILV